MNPEKLRPQDLIKSPCQENWEAMKGDDQKRHCEKCCHSVVDLSGKSLEEIRQLHRAAGGRLCGRFVLSAPARSWGRVAVGAGIASLALASCQSEKEGEDSASSGPVMEEWQAAKRPEKPAAEEEVGGGEEPRPEEILLLGDVILPEEEAVEGEAPGGEDAKPPGDPGEGEPVPPPAIMGMVAPPKMPPPAPEEGMGPV